MTVRHIVRISPTSAFDGHTKFVMAYMPRKDANGQIELDHEGHVMKLESLGGIKVGAEGTTNGSMVRVKRSMLTNEHTVSFGGPDLVELVCVYLEEYQKEAWVNVANAKVCY